MSEDWRYERDAPFQQKIVSVVGRAAHRRGYEFYIKPSDYKSPRLIGCPYPFDAEREHTLVCGGTGSGKTVLIHTLIDSIKERGDAAIVYDPEGDFLKYHYNPERDLILNPFDKRSVGWSPFNDIYSFSDWQNAAADLFHDKSSDPYWTNAPREIYAQTGHLLQLFYQETKGRNPTVSEFLRILNGPHEDLFQIIKHSPAGTQLGEKPGGRGDSLRSVISVVCARLQHLIGGNEKFSIRNWVNDMDSRGILFLSAPEDLAPSLKPLLSHWASIATMALLSRQGRQMEKPTWVILDEFASLSKIDVLADAPTRLRKFNGGMVIGLQQYSQLVDVYGEDKGLTILGQMGNKVILKVNDPTTAKFFSDLIGQREVRRKDESTSYGASNIRDGVSIQSKDTMEMLVMPEQLQNLPKFHGFMRFSPGRDSEAFPFCPIKYDFKEREAKYESCIRVDKTDSINNYIKSVDKNQLGFEI